MRDHRLDMTPEERDAQQREAKDITAMILEHAPRMALTKDRRRKRDKRKRQQQAARRRNRA